MICNWKERLGSIRVCNGVPKLNRSLEGLFFLTMMTFDQGQRDQ